MQEGRKDVRCVCVCLPLGFVPCVCLLFGIDRAWQPCKLPPPVRSLSSCVPAESKWWEASGGDGAARKMPGTLARGRNRRWTRPLLAAAQESWRKVGRRPRCWWGRPQGPGARQEAFLHTRVMLWLCFLPLGLPATSPSPVRVRRQEALVGCPRTSGRLPTWL